MLQHKINKIEKRRKLFARLPKAITGRADDTLAASDRARVHGSALGFEPCQAFIGPDFGSFTLMKYSVIHLEMKLRTNLLLKRGYHLKLVIKSSQ